MSSSFEAGICILYSKRDKLQRDIDIDIATYNQNNITDNVGYKYYKNELELTDCRDDTKAGIIDATMEEKIKKKEGELLAFTEKINRDIEAIRNMTDVKKQAIYEKSKTLKDDYMKKIQDIENNHKRPSSITFRKKEEALLQITEQIANSNAILEAEHQKKMARLRDESNKKLEAEKRKEATEKAIALQVYIDSREQIRLSDESRWAKQYPVSPTENTVVHSSYGVLPVVQKTKRKLIAYSGQDISIMSREEIESYDSKTFTKEQLSELDNRYEYLETTPVESKHLNAEFYADKKKARKEAKKVNRA